MSGASHALAQRYARALLEVATAEGEDAGVALRDELRSFAPLALDHPELGRALLHPALGTERRRRLVAAVAESASATPLLRRFLDLLASRDRMALLPAIVEAYATLANAARGVLAAEVVSATPLPAAQQQALAAVLARGGREVELRSRVDPDLLGGLLVRLGGRTYDGTVRTRLAALRRRLAASG